MAIAIKRSSIILIFIHCCSSVQIPNVVTKSGKIVGQHMTCFKGNNYEAYRGIPYAVPPVDDKRFKSPKQMKPWSDELLANRMRDNCMQNVGSGTEGSEDCLYLNVFVPVKNRNISLPTIVWIHGGGFYSGGNADREEEYLMDYNVIFVSIQYRLGILGFLSTEDQVVSRNMGLKDQSLALKWIHENIEFFGGDPNRIMLLGHSAGAASVHYHYLSPKSTGLFQSGISLSGTALDVWSMTQGSARQKAFRLGQILNCSTSDTELIIQCLRNRSADNITRALTEFYGSKNDVHFGPVIEKSTTDWFINESPIMIINSGNVYDVPWITSVVSEEGLLVVAEYTDDSSLKEINENWNAVAPFLLKYVMVPKGEWAHFSKIIREYYFGEKSISKETLRTLVHLVGDRWFIVDADKAAYAQAKANTSPVWFYKYSYRATDSLSVKLSNKTTDFGVCHADDAYLFIKNDIVNPTKSPNDMLMQKELIQLLTSFAYNRVPYLNGNWPSVDPNKLALEYLHIRGPGKATVENDDNLGDKKFWNSINFEENKL